MKKLIYQILIIAVVLSSIGLIPAVANDYDGHLQEAAIDYVVTEGLWTAGGDFGPDEAATRAQTASVMARYLSDLRPPYAGNFSDVDETSIYAGDITLATNLGLVSGSNDAFRPNDNITREEFATMLVRAYDIAGHDVYDTNYATELIMDYDSISDWAKKSVTDALGNGFMISGAKKKFGPSEAVTRAELAAAVYALHYEEDTGLAYTEEIVSSPDLSGFRVFNTGIHTDRGIGGFGVIAEFEAGPIEFYVKRDKILVKPGGTGGNNMGDSVGFAKVTDPDGNTVCRVNLDWLESGVMEKIITIPEGPAGIYQIQINGGNENENSAGNYDEYSVGIKNAKYWGFRGEDFIKRVDDSIPSEGYIYVPEKVDFLTGGISGGGVLTLKTLDGTQMFQVLGVSAGNSATCYAHPEEVGSTLPAVTGDTVYKYTLGRHSSGTIGVGTPAVCNFSFVGISPVVYETAEAARALKSGYIQYTDEYTSLNEKDTTLQLAGPLQQRARERMIEIYNEMKAQDNEEFAFAEGEIEDLPSRVAEGDLDNPLAEVSLLGAGGSAAHVQASMDTQILDPSNPWFGAILSRNTIPSYTDESGMTYEKVYRKWEGYFQKEDYPHYKEGSSEIRNWQTARYSIEDCKHPFDGAISLNGELNPYYNNPTLIKRAELVILYLVTQTPSDGMMVHTAVKEGEYTDQNAMQNRHQYENFMLGDKGFAQGYRFLRDYISPETRKITDTAILNTVDKVMNFKGQNQTNQLLMNYSGLAWTYDWSGIEFYHQQLKNNILEFADPADYIGISKIGYFIEQMGADGNGGSGYGGMSEGIWAETVYAYLSLPESRQDPALRAEIIRCTELNQMWDSYFYTPKTANFASVNSNNWTTRTDSTSGTTGSNDGKWLFRHIFPRAKKNMIVSQFGAEWEDVYRTTANKSGNIQTKHYLNDETALYSFNISGHQLLHKSKPVYFWSPWTNCENGDDCNSVHKYASGPYVIGHGGCPDEKRPAYSLGYFVRNRDQQFDDSEMPTLPFELEGDYNIVKNTYDDGKGEDGVVAIKHKGIYMLMYFNNGWQRSIKKYTTSTENAHFSSQSWMGGGPTAVWDDYFASTLVGKKPNNYSKFTGNAYYSDYTTSGLTVDDIKHSCIVGTDADGDIFISGREDSKFSWIEENKSFSLSGQQLIKASESATEAIQDRNVIWNYYLTDTGIKIEGGLDSIAAGEVMYMHLPILVQKGATYTFDEENCRIVIEHGGNKIVYSWEEGAVVSLGSYSTDTADADNYKYLRIQLTETSPLATVNVERTLAS